LVRFALQAYVYWVIISKTATMLEVLWKGRKIIALKWEAFWTLWNTRVLRGYILMQGLAAAATLFLTEATVALTLALLANPITAIVVATLAWAVAFGILYWKVKAFRDFVNAHWPLLLFFFGGAFSIAIGYAIKYFGTLRNAVGRVVNWVVAKFTWMNKKLKGILSWITPGGLLGHITGHRDLTPGFNIPFLAGGGNVTMGGLAVIGERGPELMRIPAGAQIAPLSQNAPLDLANSFGSVIRELRIRVPVSIDGRQVAEANARATLEAEARR
jgi:hypothetical protein